MAALVHSCGSLEVAALGALVATLLLFFATLGAYFRILGRPSGALRAPRSLSSRYSVRKPDVHVTLCEDVRYSWPLLVHSWPLLGRFWAALGHFWVDLGSCLLLGRT